MNQAELTHFDSAGRPRMVDVSDKVQTKREAAAESIVEMSLMTKELITRQEIAKGDVLLVAQVAGIMAAKKTSELIPLCHPLPLTKVQVNCDWLDDDVVNEKALLRIDSRVATTYLTGVEMEALTASSVAALTVYDMCKAVDRAMTIRSVQLIYKTGGKSGTFQRTDSE